MKSGLKNSMSRYVKKGIASKISAKSGMSKCGSYKTGASSTATKRHNVKGYKSRTRGNCSSRMSNATGKVIKGNTTKIKRLGVISAKSKLVRK